MLTPIVIETTPRGERSYDIYSRLHKERIILLGTAIDSEVANVIVAQLLHLNSEDQEAPITMFLNTPGGEIDAGLAILDTMNFIKAPVYTTGFGMVASMGAILITGGERGHRTALPNTRIMIHQPSGGTRGTASDIRIQAEEIIKMKEKLNAYLAERTGKPVDQVVKDAERDYYMSADEAVTYGLIDSVVASMPKK